MNIEMTAKGPLALMAAKSLPLSATGPSTAAESAAEIMTAIRQQLGLKLDSKKMPLDILVIEQVDKVPTEN